GDFRRALALDVFRVLKCGLAERSESTFDGLAVDQRNSLLADADVGEVKGRRAGGGARPIDHTGGDAEVGFGGPARPPARHALLLFQLLRFAFADLEDHLLLFAATQELREFR